MRKRGFTILELMIVITIIAILASILFPIFARSRESARRVSCASNLSQLGTALNLYAQSYDGYFPKKNNDFNPTYTYVKSIDIYFCPSDSSDRHMVMKTIKDPNTGYEYQQPVHLYSSYVYKGGYTNEDRADKVIASESKTWHDDLVNVLYLGGYVKSIHADGYKPVVSPVQPPVNTQPTMPPMPAPAS